ncbi:MAG: flagellar basal body-associated FliL family protein [Granulosicoccaceae bacterium]
MADENTENTEESGEEKPKKKRGKIFAILVVAVLMAASFAGGAVFNYHTYGVRTEIVEVEAKPEVKEPFYTEFDPSFTVNIPGDEGQHYVDINIAVLSYDRDAHNLLRQYRPLLRNKVLSVIGNRRFEELLTRDGRQKLLDDVRSGMDDVFLREDRVIEIEALYFTKFLMQ